MNSDWAMKKAREVTKQINDDNGMLAIAGDCYSTREAAEAALAQPTPARREEQVMPRVDGKPFRCDCGCNVFTKTNPLKYRCNSCEATYTGEPARGEVESDRVCKLRQ